MKRKKEDFEDRTPIGTPYEGDLKYGRCFGRQPSRHDYPAARDNSGNPTNVAIVQMNKIHYREDSFKGVKRPKNWLKKTKPNIPERTILVSELNKNSCKLSRNLTKLTLNNGNQRNNIIFNAS